MSADQSPKNEYAKGNRRTAARRGANNARRKVLLVFDLRWDDTKAMLKGVARYDQGNWDVLLDVQAASLDESWWLENTPWDGIISRHFNNSFIKIARERKIPVVDLDDAPCIEGFPKVRPNNLLIGQMGARHLLEKGFRAFAYCGVDETWSVERHRGYAEALRAAEKSCHLFTAPYAMVDPRWDAEQQKEIRQWLEDLPRPLALMACNDLRALQVVSVCRTAGYLVPNEVAILGVNNDYLRCAFGHPPLSSVETDKQLAGYRAAQILDRMMIHGETQANDEVLIDPLGIVTRQSTDVLAIDDEATSTALHYIRQFACQGISVEDVVQRAGIGRHQLERNFRKWVGRSPHAEIRAVQIARAKQLLVDTDMPLKNIADVVGIPHIEYLIVVFKEHVGLTPGAFRKKHRVTEPTPDRPTFFRAELEDEV